MRRLNDIGIEALIAGWLMVCRADVSIASSILSAGFKARLIEATPLAR